MVATMEAVTTWEIGDHHALVEFSAKHMMFTTVKGRFTGVTGSIVYDEAQPRNSRVDVEIDATTLDSRFGQRDDHLKSPDFLDIANYPKITFRSTRVAIDGQSDGPSGPIVEKGRVYGDLTIRGVTRPVVLNAEITGRGVTPWGAEVAGFSATGAINRKEWGLNWNQALEAGGVMVGDEIKLHLDVEAIKKA